MYLSILDFKQYKGFLDLKLCLFNFFSENYFLCRQGVEWEF